MEISMTVEQLLARVQAGELDTAFVEQCAYDAAELPMQHARIEKLGKAFNEKYNPDGAANVMLFSVGGRSEISGNHTDHNYGRVIAAAVSLDVLAIAAPTADGVVRLQSAGFDYEDYVTPADIEQPREDWQFNSQALIAGMEKAFLDRGYKVGGFNAYTTSNVLRGSGLSSSAAFEVMIGNILNYLYNDGKVSNVEIAKMAQFAENVYFGKPCGLMDQTACAVGGFITIDFKDPKNPVIEPLAFDLTAAGYALCITDTGGNHADLTPEYAAVPKEMKYIAEKLGVSVLRETTKEAVLAAYANKQLGKYPDRAFLRAVHFFDENERVGKQVDALKAGDTDTFLRYAVESGLSSYRYLQNVYAAINPKEQGVSTALYLAEDWLKANCEKCAYRVHGGGFAGTMQAFVPLDKAQAYKEYMEQYFGKGRVYLLRVRKAGATRLA